MSTVAKTLIFLLFCRLEFLDRHGYSVEPDVEYHMKLPDISTFMDIHGGMTSTLPKVTAEDIDTYMAVHDAKWSDKVPSLYKERFTDTFYKLKGSHFCF